MHVNDKSGDRSGHILIAQTHEVAEAFVYDTFVAMTMQKDMQQLREDCELIPPTIDRQLNHSSHPQIC